MEDERGDGLLEFDDFDFTETDESSDYSDSTLGDDSFLTGEAKYAQELMARMCRDNGIPFLYEAPLPPNASLEVPDPSRPPRECIVPWDQDPPRPNRKIACHSIEVYDEFIIPAVRYAHENKTFDVPPNLVDVMKKFMLMDCTPSEVPGERQAKQSTTNPAIAKLNNAIHEFDLDQLRNAKVLAFGCGDGINDGFRIACGFAAENIKANQVTVDMLDIIPQHHDCREITLKGITRRLKGENLPSDPAKLPTGRYDLIWAKDSMQFATRVFGGRMPTISEMIRSLKPKGVIIGSYCNGRNAISIKGPYVGNSGRGFSPHVKTLSLTKISPHAWVQNMLVFGHAFSEPFVHANHMEILIAREGGDGMVIDCDDIAKFVPFEAAHMCPTLQPEAAGWSILEIKKATFIRNWKFTGFEGNQQFEEITGGGSLMPNRLAAGGSIMSRHHIKRVMNGGPFLYSEKLDGFPVLGRLSNAMIVLKSYQGIRTYYAPNTDYDIEFQCEYVDDRYVIVAIHSINGAPVTLGYGLSFLYSSIGKELLAQFDFKYFYTSPPNRESVKDWEGIVISKYTQPPPDLSKAPGEINVRFCNVGLIYVKHRPTVDIMSGAFGQVLGPLGLNDYRICKIADKIFTMPLIKFDKWDSVMEIYVDDGSLKCFRPDKRTGNNEDQVRKILNCIPMKDVFDLFTVNLENFGRDNDDTRFDAAIVGLPFEQWTTRDIVNLAMSYPKGITTIPPEQRVAVEELRLSLYNNPHLLAILDMPSKLAKDNDKVMTMFDKSSNHPQVQKKIYDLEKKSA